MGAAPPPIPSSGKKPRGFPWRLWLYALVMTAGAVAGGYFTWQYRSAGKKDKDDLHTCAKSLADTQAKQASHDKDLKICTDSLGAATLKVTELEKQTTESTKNLTATQQELITLREKKAQANKRLAAIEDIRKQ